MDLGDKLDSDPYPNWFEQIWTAVCLFLWCRLWHSFSSSTLCSFGKLNVTKCPSLGQMCEQAASSMSREEVLWRRYQFATYIQNQNPFESSVCNCLYRVACHKCGCFCEHKSPLKAGPFHDLRPDPIIFYLFLSFLFCFIISIVL